MTLRVAIFTDETGWHTRQLQAALRARGAVGRCVDLADCRVDTTAAWHGLAIPGFGHALPDAALVRGIAGGTFEQVTKRLGVLHALRELGVVVYNDARAIERSVDKSMTSLLLHAAAIPTPPTWVTESAAQARRIAVREGAAGHALVLKPLFGSQGHGLRLVGQVGGGHHPLPPLDADYGSLAYLQRFVPPLAVPGFDWRVLVIGGRALTAMRRVSEHWVHNVAQGARCEPAPLTPALARLAERAAAALGLDYAGVDLMPTPDGWLCRRIPGMHGTDGIQRTGGVDATGVTGGSAGPSGRDGVGGGIQVIEVNGVAAWRGLQRVAGFNIARAIVDDLVDRVLATDTTDTADTADDTGVAGARIAAPRRA